MAHNAIVNELHEGSLTANDDDDPQTTTTTCM